MLVSDGRAAYGAFAYANAFLHIPIIASHGEHVYEGLHIQNVNAYTSRFKGWMAPFRGVASKYLASYLSWRRMIERDGDRLTPRHCLFVRTVVPAVSCVHLAFLWTRLPGNQKEGGRGARDGLRLCGFAVKSWAWDWMRVRLDWRAVAG